MTGDVTVASDTGSRVALGSGWTFNNPSMITSVTPSSGQVGTAVVIAGTLLLSERDGTTVVSVTLNGIAADLVSGTSQTSVQVVARSSLGGSGLGDVVVTADSGAVATAVNGWRYLAVGVISSVLPAVGQYGTRVTISGTLLLGGGISVQSATLNGVAASVEAQSDLQIVIRAGNGTAGSGDVRIVSNTGAVVQASGAWAYAVASAVTSVTPSSGQGSTGRW